MGTLAPACATRGDVDYLSEEHQAINRQQAELERRVTSLEEAMTRLEGLLTSMRADLRAELGAVRQGLNAMESAVRGTQSRIENLQRYTPPAPAAPAPGDTTAAAETAVDPIALYNASLNDYHQGRQDLARQGFQEYMRRFSRGINASDAQYWLGAIEYDEGRHREAIVELQRVVDGYPDSAKAPLALRKIGDAWRALGENGRAQSAYRALIERYPDSSEAEGARRELGIR
ncbi:MAG TPA: tetratricopeptide repeat protein [Gemmatimonadota bacterium]|nr:tetratricopeptide repeat protein [Gemmatimonadota bacterium]